MSKKKNKKNKKNKNILYTDTVTIPSVNADPSIHGVAPVNRSVSFGKRTITPTKSKKIYLKDEIQGKSYEELMKLLPMMVTIERTNERKSFNVEGFGPDYMIITAASSYEYEPDIGDWGNTAYFNYCETVPFKDINKDFIVANKPTEKQQKWLDDHGYENQTISGYHAWHIIHDAVEKSKKRAEERKRQQEDYEKYDHPDFYDDFDAYDFPDCPDPWGN